MNELDKIEEITIKKLTTTKVSEERLLKKTKYAQLFWGINPLLQAWKNRQITHQQTMRGMEFKLVNYDWVCLSTVVHYRQKTAIEPKGSVRACWSCCPKRYNLSHVLSPGHPVFPFNHFTVTAWKYRFGRSDLFLLLFQAEWRRGEEIKLGIQSPPPLPPRPLPQPCLLRSIFSVLTYRLQLSVTVIKN